MSYLSVANFWKYQNADVWKKSKTHPPWFKHYVHRDRELDKLSLGGRLLFWELVAAATRYSNVLEEDLNWLYAETRVDVETIREELPGLVKGGWLSRTSTRRRSRKLSRRPLDDPRDQDVEEEVETPTTLRKVSTSSDRSEERDAAAHSPSNGAAPLGEERLANLATFVHREWDEYPDRNVLADELTDRGATLDQARTLITVERESRKEQPA